MIISKKAYELFHKGAIALAQIEQNGIKVDIPFYKKQDKIIIKKIIRLEDNIKNTKEYKIWRKTYKEKLNLDSSQQLGDILFNKLNIEPSKYTEKGNPSVDQESLEKIDNQFTKDLLQIKKLKKVKNTFLSQITREAEYGIIHPFFHLHTTTSTRSSSSNPNWQNLPIRDPELSSVIRGGIIPRLDRQILEVDYGGIEVRISACCHKDPAMLEYIKDNSKDMHRDMAMQCYILELDEVSKEARYCAKNKFVFPQFYGDYFGNCATALWEAIDQLKLKTNKSNIPLKKHLKSKGIKNYKQFEEHIKNVEDDFWNNRFSVYTKWKEEQLKKYQKRGYVKLKTGFICSDVMGDNQVLNRPIQGPAFHCLLWSLTKIQEIANKEEWETLIIGQIHDSIIFDVVPSELEHVLKTCRKVMCKDIRRHWDWIIVPLEIDAEITGINQPWSTKKEIEIL